MLISPTPFELTDARFTGYRPHLLGRNGTSRVRFPKHDSVGAEGRLTASLGTELLPATIQYNAGKQVGQAIHRSQRLFEVWNSSVDPCLDCGLRPVRAGPGLYDADLSTCVSFVCR
jgi:hypothetical protein